MRNLTQLEHCHLQGGNHSLWGGKSQCLFSTFYYVTLIMADQVLLIERDLEFQNLGDCSDGYVKDSGS